MELVFYAGLAAVAVVGLIEWAKNFVAFFLDLGGWIWSLAVLGASVVCGALVVYGAGVCAKTPLMALLVALVVLALAQIGYEGIKKAILQRARNALSANAKDEEVD